jgi:hypothetical protein
MIIGIAAFDVTRVLLERHARAQQFGGEITQDM